MPIPLFEAPERRWECEHCNYIDSTREAEPHTRFHTCSGLGMTAPMVPQGSRARVTANEREDFVKSEDVQTNADGRPIMSISTEYPDGRNDLVVFAPTANNSANA